MCRRSPAAAARPRIARLLLSVAPLVKITSPRDAGDDCGDPIARPFDSRPCAPSVIVRAAAGVPEVCRRNSAASRRGRSDPAVSSPRNRDRPACPATSSCTRTREEACARPRAGACCREWAMFQAVDSGEPGAPMLGDRPACRRGRPNTVHRRCDRGGVPSGRRRVLRRFSGGGAVVLGQGCLNYAVAMSLGFKSPSCRRRGEFSVRCSGRIVAALGIPGLSIDGRADIALNGRKVSGNAQRRGRRALLHHGTLLYAFDPRWPRGT